MNTFGKTPLLFPGKFKLIPTQWCERESVRGSLGPRVKLMFLQPFWDWASPKLGTCCPESRRQIEGVKMTTYLHADRSPGLFEILLGIWAAHSDPKGPSFPGFHFHFGLLTLKLPLV